MTQNDLDSYFDNSKRECKFWKSAHFAKFSKNSYNLSVAIHANFN